MSEKGREAYELFVLRRRSRKALLRRNQPGHPKDGEYRNAAVQTGWEAWAECKSVLIVLPQINPEMFNEDVLFGFEKARNSAKAKLEALGFKVV